MFRLLFVLVLAGAMCGGAVGCKQDKTQAELQADKVKTFRDRQKKAAARAYQDIVEKYPDSPHAAEAKEKVQALGGVAAATPRPK